MTSRPLPLLHSGRPAPWSVVAPLFLAALAGWAAAAAVLLAAAPDVAVGRLSAEGPVLAAHLVGLVLFPFAVAAAAWHLLPAMLRNDLPNVPRLRFAAALLAGGAVLAPAIALDLRALGWTGAAALLGGLALVGREVVGLIRRAPRGKLLVVSRPGLVLALAHALVAFALGGVAFGSGGPEPLGIVYERLLLVHVLVALLGWLTVLVLVVGRTLVPMLSVAPAPEPRRAPLVEVAFLAGLWLCLAGLALGARPLAAAGVLAMAASLVAPVAAFLRAAARGTIGPREGPAAHLLSGVAFLAQAAALGTLGLLGALDARRAAIACVLLLLAGWAAGVIVGHVGKLLALSAWANWPPGPRPKQAELYPRLPWRAEAALHLVAVELLTAAALAQSATTARAGAALLAVSAALAASGAVLTVLRVRRRRGQPRSGTMQTAA
jgi:hypothetical protein